MHLSRGTRTVDCCPACQLIYSTLSEPWCPVCNAELITLLLTPIRHRPEVFA
jgi:hypothetical protein